MERVKNKRSAMILEWLLGIILWLLGFIAGVSFSELVKTEAATLYGDEPLGGFSYMTAICNGDIIPEEDDPYLKLFGEIRKLDVWKYDITLEEYDILVRIVEAEATGGNKEQKMNVASCVLARMESPNWPNDIRSVVFQKRQFSPIDDGRYYTVKIQRSTEEAVEEVLHYGKTHDCLWFCSDGSYRKENSYHRLNHTWVFFDGEHHYFYD